MRYESATDNTTSNHSPGEGWAVIIGRAPVDRGQTDMGLRVAELLSANPPPRALVTTTQAPADVLRDHLRDIDLVAVIEDSLASARLAGGRIDRFVYVGPGLPNTARYRRSVRPASLPPSMRVGAVLAGGVDVGLSPRQVWIYTIANAVAAPVSGIAADAEGIIRQAADKVRTDVARWRRCHR